MKIPVQLIIGPKDKENNEVSVRFRKDGEFVEEKVALNDLATFIQEI